jgi:protease-4
MSLDSDYLVDRRRLSRKITFWRIAAFGVAVLAVIGAGLAWRARTGISGASHIARVDVSGVITGDRKTLDLLKSIGRSTATRAVIVSINSPGGTVTGSEALFDALRELSAKKPTVAVVTGMAASGGYIAAMGTERIVAQRTSLVGSIGVLFQYPNVVKLLDTVGVKMETVKSAPLKASPNPFEPTTPASEAAIAALVADSFGWFKEIVGERRGIAGADLAGVSDGRVFTGHQAIALKLVDELGSEKQAIAWLEKAKGIPTDLKVRDWKPSSDRGLGLWTAMSGAARFAGLNDLANTISAVGLAAEQPMLDGLLAVWHP